ncbi:Predicted membrane protein [Chlamydia trachomatis]|nr:Predicted membrane protein [Chlamydia trachomatis]CRH87573.1 Predicted membrane protein [Chlamydia trachomatis]
MTQTQFLDELAQLLQPLPREEYNEAIDYFTELFEEAGPENESSILDGLGSPKEVANELISKLASSPATIQQKENTSNHSNFHQEDTTFSQGEADSNQARVDLDDFNQLFLHFGSLDISIFQTKEKNAYLLADSTNQLEIENKDGHLNIRQSFNKQKEKFSFGFNMEFLIKGILTEVFSGNTIKLYIPQDKKLEQVSIQLGSGGVMARHLAITSGTIQTGSGDIDLNQCQLTQVKLSAGSGDMDLRSCQVKKGIIQIGSGDISLTDSTINYSQIQLGAGDMEINKGQLEQVTLQSASGDMELHHCNFSGKSSLTTASGDLEINGFAAAAQTTSLQIETNFGDCETSLPLVKTRRGYTYHAPESHADLILQTKSGDIEIY